MDSIEPQLIDYYKDFPFMVNIINNLNNEYNVLEEKNKELIKELKFYKSAFEYPLNNSAIFNLVRVKCNGEDQWIDRVKITEQELKKLDQCNTVKYLLENCNPRCER